MMIGLLVNLAERFYSVQGFLSISFFFSLKDNVTLLDQHDRLNTSLAALTRHVAHVQFRLQQVLSAPTPEDREVEDENLQPLSFSSIVFLFSLEFTFPIA